MYVVLNGPSHPQVLPCQWVQCIDPPTRENMTHDYASRGAPYEFGEEAVYTCRSNYYFEEDRAKADHRIPCLSDPVGTFDEPDTWPRCVASNICAFCFFCN